MIMETASIPRPRNSSGNFFRWTLIVLAVIAVIVLILLPRTPHYVGAVERVPKPSFPFEVAWEDESEIHINAIIFIAPEHYSGGNLRQVLFWYAQSHEEKYSVHIKLFTNRNRAVPEN
jgi:hypothetical protein